MTADNQVTLEPVAWMYRYVVQYAPKLECAKRLPDKIAFSIARWTDAEARHWTETPLYTQPAINSGGEVERAVMVCPQCEGEGSYADGLDEAACSTECTRCAGNGWIVDCAALAAMDRAPGVEVCGWCRKPVTECAGYGRHDNVYGEQCAQPEPRPVEAGEVDQSDIDLAIKVLRLIGIKTTADRLASGWKPPTSSGLWEALEAFATHRQQSLSAARAEIEAGNRLPFALKVLREQILSTDHPVSEWERETVKKIADALSTDQGREGE